MVLPGVINISCYDFNTVFFVKFNDRQSKIFANQAHFPSYLYEQLELVLFFLCIFLCLIMICFFFNGFMGRCKQEKSMLRMLEKADFSHSLILQYLHSKALSKKL